MMQMGVGPASVNLPFGRPLPAGQRVDALAAMRTNAARQTSAFIAESAQDFVACADRLIAGDGNEREFFDAFGRLAADLSKGLRQLEGLGAMSDSMSARVLPAYEKLKDAAVAALAQAREKLAVVAEQFAHADRVREFVAAASPQVQAYAQSFKSALEVARPADNALRHR